MKKITKEELNRIIENHQHWLNKDCEDWKSMRADLREVDLSGANLYGVDLSGANLSGADLEDASLKCANLYGVDLSGANLSGADLSDATLYSANLRWANVCDANLSCTDIRETNLSNTNLSGAKWLTSSIDYLKDNFEFTSDGLIAYKTFNCFFGKPESWSIEEGSVISENVNPNRTDDCGCGINVGTIHYVKNDVEDHWEHEGLIWKVLIRWEWLPGVVVPYNTDGRIRCERCELLEIVKEV